MHLLPQLFQVKEWQVNSEESQQNDTLQLFSTTWNIFVGNVHVDLKHLCYMYVDKLIHSM